MIKHTMFTNGTIRNAAGVLVGWFNQSTATLILDGVPGWIQTDGMEHAMDLVAARFK